MKAITAILSLSAVVLPLALSTSGCYHRRREVIVERRERPRTVIVEERRPPPREVIIEERRPPPREVIIERR